MAENVPFELHSLQAEIQRNLSASAAAYFRIGIAEYLNAERKTWENYQAAVGNLAISIELMLKAFVAHRCFRKLYITLPDELDIFLSDTSKAPKSITFRPFENALRTFDFKTIDFDRAISLYGIYFPKEKSELHSYFAFLAATRNVSVHAALPEFQRFDLARVSYLAIKVMKHSAKEGIIFEPPQLRSQTNQILKQFDRERIERVTIVIKRARDNAKRLTKRKTSIIVDPDDFTCLAIPCPICGSDVYVSGETENDTQSEDEPSLTFRPDSFFCEECGLEIPDARDFALVGLDRTYDRSDQFNEWCRQYAEWA